MRLLRNLQIIDVVEKRVVPRDIAIDKGRIAAVGRDLGALVASADEVLACDGLFAMPGLVDAHSHLGMWEDSIDFEGADGNESSDPITPQMRAIDAINPFDRCFEEARNAGITTVMTGPGSANVIGGSFAIVKTHGDSVEAMLVRHPAAMKIAFGENPKRVYSEQKRAPLTRMATAALLREALQKAQAYKDKLESADPDKRPDFDAKCDALLPVLRREIPLKAHAHRADDIQTALRIAAEFGLDITIDHATDGVRIATQLASHNVKLIVGPLLCDRCKPELASLSLETPRRLAEAGLSFALMTDHPVTPEPHLPVVAALCVREGLDEWTALRAITITPAEILGVQDRLGSLEAGKDADIVLFDGHPLDLRSHVQQVFIDGERVFARDAQGGQTQ